MKILKLKIINYRTIEELELEFPSFYTAISGKNDSGKTNVVNALRGLMKEDIPFPYYEDTFSIKDDFPKWKDTDNKDKFISIIISIHVNKDKDAGIYNFLTTYLALDSPPDDFEFFLEFIHKGETQEQEVKVTVQNNTIDGLRAQEILKKLQNSRTFLFHNSTDTDSRYQFRYSRGLLRDLSEENLKQVDKLINNVNKGLQKVAKLQQREITELLGKLENKYKVGLSIPIFDLSTMPVSISLGDSKINVNLDDWGSGTQNRTLILLTLMRAKQISNAGATASKVTPIIVIEEPESFLHPSAQAEFGRVLQDLAEEFKVQVIVTTHSPYLLSISKPESNVLLERKVVRNQLRETILINTAKENWMDPFGIALGIDNELFNPWRNVLFNHSDLVLLVEGDTDKEYFELLKDDIHGKNKLLFNGEILPYNGKDNLNNNVLLKFIINKYRKAFITFDLDAMNVVANSLSSLNFREGEDYCPIGINEDGKANIEGLVPEEILTKVYSQNPNLIQRAMNASSTKEKKTAKNQIKKKILEEFKLNCKDNLHYFKNFYKVTHTINKAFSKYTI